jgi:energy-coupling factor transporter transmembrane protein EcfT
VISETTVIAGNFFVQFLQILDFIINLGFSAAYFIAMIISSFAIFLNLIAKIRNNFYWSLLAFLGIPTFCVLFIVINLLIDISPPLSEVCPLSRSLCEVSRLRTHSNDLQRDVNNIWNGI